MDIFGFEVNHEYINQYVEAVEHNSWTFEVHFDTLLVFQTVWGILYLVCSLSDFNLFGSTTLTIFMDHLLITLSGDPICFGDSGGPLYKSLGKGKGHVLLGVFSYILWGVCGGPRDLAYYVNVEHNIDWIFQYVPKNSTCK